MSIKSPQDIKEGLRYKVVEGLHEGKEGTCVGQDISSFGYVWKKLETDDGELVRTRWSDLEKAEDKSRATEDSAK